MFDPDMLDSILLIDEMRTYFLEHSVYDPIVGRGSMGRRTKVRTPVEDMPWAYIPDEMLFDPDYPLVLNNSCAWRRLRCRHDFEFWCASCAVVKPKFGDRDIPMHLNSAQRHLLYIIEQDRLAGKPLRFIILKARQWGCSTLIQIYMAWIQLVHRHTWNSLICAHSKDTAIMLRAMYSKLLANYPDDLWDGDEKPRFLPFEGASNIKRIAGRGSCVTIASAERQNSVRGADFAMAHLSETAFWPSSRTRSPEGVVRSACAGIAIMPLTMVVIESTANGVGNYFHSEWLRAKERKSDKHAVFIPWHSADMYTLKAPDRREIALSLSEAEYRMWLDGATFDQIYWYRMKSREYASPYSLHAEFPGNDVDAFANTATAVFAADAVGNLRASCTPALNGEISNEGNFSEDPTGELKVWQPPEKGSSYVAAVDVGGRSLNSDWSVISVLKAPRDGIPEVVAQWRGHIDHDLLVRKCASVGRFYNSALLVIESNTFETSEYGGAGASNLFVLSRLADEYPNVYRRHSFDRLSKKRTSMVGFHTNRATKAILIGGMIEAVREGSYIERDSDACNELLTYEQQRNGTYAAKQGYHDDILMTRAMALHVIATDLKPVYVGKLPQRASW